MNGIFGLLSKKKINQSVIEKSIEVFKQTEKEGRLHIEGKSGDVFLSINQMTTFNQGKDKVIISKNNNKPYVVIDGLLFGENFSVEKNKKNNDWKINNEIGEKYLLHKKNVFNELDGQFALSIFDDKKQDLWLARDRFGVKFLYYYFDSEYFIFSTKLKAITSLLFMKNKIKLDEKSIVKYFSYKYIPAPFSVFRSIKKLEVSSYVKFNIKDWKLNNQKKYWDLSKISLNKGITKSQAVSKMDELMKISIRKRLSLLGKSDPTVLMSGGADSILVATYLSMFNQNTKSITYTAEGVDNNQELLNAQKVAKKLGINNKHYVLTGRDAKKILIQEIENTDEPLNTVAFFPLSFLFSKSQKNSQFMFVGNAAELIFDNSDFPKHEDILAFKMLFSLVKFVRRLGNKTLESYKCFQDMLSFPLTHDYIWKFFFLDKDLLESELDKLVNIFPKNYSAMHSKELERIKKFKQEDLVNMYLYFASQHECANLYVPKDDVIANVVGKNVMYPYIDKDMVEFGFSLENKWKTNAENNKFIIKELIKKYLGDEFIIKRARTLVEFPLGDWIRNEFKDVFEEYLFYPNEFINTSYVKELFDNHNNRVEDYAWPLFKIFQFQVFMKKYKDTV